MTIEELKIKHFKEYLKSIVTIPEKDHYKISIQFAIKALEEMGENTRINDVIQELKQYLDE